MPLIVLARHGRPVWDRRTPIAGYQLEAWNAGNDAAPIDITEGPPPGLVAHAHDCALLLASTLRRSIESAELAAPDRSAQVDELYREVFLPTAINSNLRLPPPMWTTIARIGWYFGWSPGVESHVAARARARIAAGRLIELAGRHDHIVLVGHGMMNGMIGKRLLRCGWRGPLFRPRRYWAFGVYRKE